MAVDPRQVDETVGQASVGTVAPAPSRSRNHASGKLEEFRLFVSNPQRISQSRVSAWSLVLRLLVLLAGLVWFALSPSLASALSLLLLFGLVVLLVAFSRELHSLAVGIPGSTASKYRPRWLVGGVLDLIATTTIVAVAGPSRSPMAWLYFSAVMAFSVYAINPATRRGVRKYVAVFALTCVACLILASFANALVTRQGMNWAYLIALSVGLVLFAFACGMLAVTLRSHEFVFSVAKDRGLAEAVPLSSDDAVDEVAESIAASDRRLETAGQALEDLRDDAAIADAIRQRAATLSEQALEVWKLEAKGLTASEIARELNMSDSNVEYHRGEINKRLGAKRQIDRRLYAVVAGHVSASEFLALEIEPGQQ